MTTDLDTLFPVPQTVQAGGKAIAVTPVRVRQLNAFARAMAPALAALEGSGAALLQGEQMVGAVAVATGEPESWLLDLPAGEYLALATAVMEANADFFARWRPAMEISTATLMRIAGPTPSPNSPPPATGSTT